MEYKQLLKRLVYHAKTQPEKNAIYLLNSTDINLIDAQLTYHELIQSAYNLANIIKKQAEPCERVILCYPTGIDFIIAFYACLLAKVVAVAVIVPSNLGLVKKFAAIYEDCKARLILTDRKTKSQYLDSAYLVAHSGGAPLFPIAPIMATDEQFLDSPVDLSCLSSLEVNLDDLAFLQYTSGSTANPKGVMISHGNLINNIVDIAHAFNSKKEAIGLNWLPLTHDMGLIGSFLHSIHIGAELYLMSPLSFIRRPMTWLQALSKYRANVTGCPNFGLKMCIDHLSEDNVKALDLSQLHYIIVGSEPISFDVVSDFMNSLARAGLSRKAIAPAYGLAESTVMVSTRQGVNALTVNYLALNNNLVSVVNRTNQDAITLVSCGRPYQTVQIFSEKTKTRCAENEVGEIWLHGKSIAQGYWSQGAESQLDFEATLANDKRLFFRTGDIGFLHQGELYVVGRIKDVLIINGLNYYPQDIEQAVLACDAILHKATCIVFRWRTEEAVTDGFIIMIRPNKRLSDDVKRELSIKIKKQILKEFQLVPHDLQFVTVSLPKTTSGKLQRYACNTLYKEHCQHQQLQREHNVEDV